MEKGVINVVRYYHHKTDYIGGKEDNICNNICKGLDIIRIINYKLKDLMMFLRPARIKINIRKGQSSSRKRSSNYTNTPLPPSKCIYLDFLPKGGRHLITLN